MINTIKELLEKENISTYGFVDIKDCIINKKHLLDRVNIENGFVVIFAIPYYSRACENKNISSYAVPRDYHLYLDELKARMIPRLKEKYADINFGMFTDHSPIDERDCALKAGIGIMGKNGLIITEKYSSYVFLAELFVGAPLDPIYSTLSEIKECENCGLCKKACPKENGECFSATTQKKGQLSDSEKKLIKKHGAWGCDICTEVCPYTKNAIKTGTVYTPISFFNDDLIPVLTKEKLLSMSDEDFMKRAYSWRGKETVLRNLEIIENDQEAQ